LSDIETPPESSPVVNCERIYQLRIPARHNYHTQTIIYIKIIYVAGVSDCRLEGFAAKYRSYPNRLSEKVTLGDDRRQIKRPEKSEMIAGGIRSTLTILRQDGD